MAIRVRQCGLCRSLCAALNPRLTLRVAAAVARREWATARLERRHYHADHFCYSWHMDLDCKMAAYGIYLGFVIDGDSRMVLHAAVLPDKTACRVYEELFRPAVAAWGFPDQLNTDQGEEWRLCVFVCFFVWWAAGRASPAGRLPHKIVPSTSNVCCRRLAFFPMACTMHHAQHPSPPLTPPQSHIALCRLSCHSTPLQQTTSGSPTRPSVYT